MWQDAPPANETLAALVGSLGATQERRRPPAVARPRGPIASDVVNDSDWHPAELFAAVRGSH